MTRFSPSDPRAQLAHLQVVAGDAHRDALLEVRYRLPHGGMRAEFHSVDEPAQLVASVNRYAASTDVYVGCAPRDRRASGRDAISQVWTLWAECDGPEASAAARAHMPRPALVVASGTPGNVHAYWPLRHPASPEDAERANLRLATALGADRACFDAARILRPPGSWNHKHRPPRRVDVVDQRLAARFELDEVVGGLPQLDPTFERSWQPTTRRHGALDPLMRLPPAAYVAELLGVRPVSSSRKVRCPFHEDREPSLHVYPTAERGWFCFSCRRGGSVYDLAAELWGVGTRGREFVELRRRLLELFRVELARPQHAIHDRALNR